MLKDFLKLLVHIRRSASISPGRQDLYSKIVPKFRLSSPVGVLRKTPYGLKFFTLGHSSESRVRAVTSAAQVRTCKVLYVVLVPRYRLTLKSLPRFSYSLSYYLYSLLRVTSLSCFSILLFLSHRMTLSSDGLKSA